MAALQWLAGFSPQGTGKPEITTEGQGYLDELAADERRRPRLPRLEAPLSA